MREAIIYAELLWKLWKENKKALGERLLERIRKEGKSYLLLEILNYLQEKDEKEKGFIRGTLKLALATEINDLKNKLERKLKAKIYIEKTEIDESLILGGVFITKELILDFSFKNLIKKALGSKNL